MPWALAYAGVALIAATVLGAMFRLMPEDRNDLSTDAAMAVVGAVAWPVLILLVAAVCGATAWRYAAIRLFGKRAVMPAPPREPPAPTP